MRSGGALLLLALAAAGCATTPPDPQGRERAAAVLADAATKGDITLLVGAQPDSCWVSGPAHEVCTWSLDAHHPGWRKLAPTVPTDRPVAMVCELPTDETPRERDACSVHARVFVPLEYQVARYRTNVVSASGARASGEVTSRDASDVLEAQQTLADLSRLVGSGPDRCEPDVAATQVCSWNVGDRLEGYQLLAAVARADGRVRLLCKLPTDGRLRDPGSCRAIGL